MTEARSSQQIHRLESRVFSQNGEDGIIDGIFAAIGTTNRYFVEFGVGAMGSECNTRNLAENHGWTGLLMDGMDQPAPTDIRQEFITAENISALFLRHGVPDEFDLLSIDIDSNDYWVFDAIDPRFRPRVLVLEYNASLGSTDRLTIAYDATHVWDVSAYFGASLAALDDIAQRRGYRLIGCDSIGVNCFFVREDCHGGFEALTPGQAYQPPGYGIVEEGRHIGFSPTSRRFEQV
jgi:hypothetical protein